MSVPSRIRNAPKTFHLSVRLDPQPWRQVRQTVGDKNDLKASGARHLLILVHGFNNSEKDATNSYGRFFSMIEAPLQKSRVAPDAVAHFHWPGDLTGGAASYPFDIDQARGSAGSLARYLAAFPSPAGDRRALKVSLVGHSLGCRLIIEMLNAVPAAARPEIVFVGLMAAAVGVGLVDAGSPLAPIGNLPKTLVKFSSTHDWVLSTAFPLGQSAAFAAGIDDGPYREAVGRNGNPASFGDAVLTRNGHGEYWPDPRIAEDIVPMIDSSVAMVRPASQALAGNTLPSRGMPPPRRLEGRRLPS